MHRILPAYMSAVCCLWLAWPAGGAAQTAMDAWASWVTAPKVWKGQTVPWPDAAPRPVGVARLDSRRFPLHVHGSTQDSPRLAAALVALERAYDVALEQGWPLPYPDGGAGGTQGFDLYLSSGARTAACAEVDGPIAWSDFDAGQTYAVVDAGLGARSLPACVLSAFVQAGLRAHDPSEAESVLQATGDFAAWSALGELGCDEAFVAAQAHPGSDDFARSAGLFLAVASERHDGGTGSFIRALWELTRQRSAGLVDAGVLRASPDLWEVLALATQTASDALDDLIEEFSVARAFSARGANRDATPYKVLRAVPAPVPLLRDLRVSELPKHVRPDGDGLAPLGSAYVRVAVAAGVGGELRVWLRGESGPRWSMVAVRLGADGRELGRVAAPRRRVPDSYLPVLLTPDTTEVLIVVTHLLEKLPDPDRPSPPPHSFELILTPKTDPG